MKKIAETIVSIYLELGSLSFIVSIRFGILGLFVLIYNLNQYLNGDEVHLSLGLTIVISIYVIITTLPWFSGLYLKFVNSEEKKRKEKNPQFLNIIQQKIKSNQELDEHEYQFFIASLIERMRQGEYIGVEEEAYHLLHNSEELDDFLFHSSNARFSKVFDYLAKTLHDDDLRFIISKIPTRMKGFIHGGNISERALMRVQKLYKN